MTLISAMSFNEDKRFTYLRRDLNFNPSTVGEMSPNILNLKGWDQVSGTITGERFVLRSYYRPSPDIFISESRNTDIENVTVHYSEGMGLLAQMSENINLEGFNVSLKGDNDPRCFTTQADVTHFSALKGVIISINGLYENMADDAIDVHETYLKFQKRVDDFTVQARYIHNQALGFKWGALFSIPKRVICEGNLFDHTHGTAILLCGDSNGWFETGVCRDVTIRKNKFVNALTANYQFTNAVISIFPEIPNIEDQIKFFHFGIVIEDNVFEMFDQPIVYAKTTDGLIFRNNTILHNNDFEPFHWNKYKFFF